MEEKINSRIKKLALTILGIVLIAIVMFLRFYGLGSIPHGINVDEASYGYDSYSLLETGKDIWGNRTSFLKSFGDFKPAGQAYTMMPGIKFFGLNNFTTRLPSAIFGFLTLVTTYFLLNTLFKKKYLALLAALVLALSPWHFGLSRLFYEPVPGLFFISLSLWFEILFIKNPRSPKYLLIATVTSALAGYYYSVLRYLGVGLIFTATIVACLPYKSKIIKLLALSAVTWLIVAAPYLKDVFGSRGFIRLGQESALQEFGNTLVITENRQMCYLVSNKNPGVAKLCYALWNKPGEKIVNTLRVYIELLSPKYLFLSGYQKDVVPANFGAFLPVMLPFYLLGIYYLITKLSSDKVHRFIFFSWLLGSVPIAIAGAQNIHRNVVGLYLAFIIITYGINFGHDLLAQVKNRLYRRLLVLIIAAIFLWSQARYLAQYFFVYTRQQPEIWLTDSDAVMQWLLKNRSGREIYFYDYDMAPLIYAFYTQLDPSVFRAQSSWSKENSYGWIHPESIAGLLSNQGNIWIAICRHEKPNLAPHLLVTHEQSDWSEASLVQFKNYTGVHTLHEIYDSQQLYTYLSNTHRQTLINQCKLLNSLSK